MHASHVSGSLQIPFSFFHSPNSVYKPFNGMAHGHSPSQMRLVASDACIKYPSGALAIHESELTKMSITNALEDTLRKNGSYDTDDGLKLRAEVLEKMSKLFVKWVGDLGRAKGVSSYQINQQGKVYPFGSYKLGMHAFGADIDALCVAPRHVDRADFFTGFVTLLRSCPGVTDLRAVEEAFVPVVKLRWDGVELDLVFARLNVPQNLDDQNLDEEKLVKNLDSRCLRSLNGYRVTAAILNCVPDKDSFRITLRACRLWAKRRGIYSNVMGYMGGVSWSMLIARVCQIHPNVTPAVLFQRFFEIFANWNWPSPVLIKPVEDLDLGYSVWNPRTNVADRYHQMPIITPVYPHMNSTFNVSTSARLIIQRELIRGQKIAEKIVVHGQSSWDELFERTDFFNMYSDFVVVSAITQPCRQDHIEWVGFIESKLRHLVLSLERDARVKIAHIYPVHFYCGEVDGFMCTKWYIGLEFPSNLVDIVQSTETFERSLDSQARVRRDGMKMKVINIRREDIPTSLPKEFHEEHLVKPITPDENGTTEDGEAVPDVPGDAPPQQQQQNSIEAASMVSCAALGRKKARVSSPDVDLATRIGCNNQTGRLVIHIPAMPKRVL